MLGGGSQTRSQRNLRPPTRIRLRKVREGKALLVERHERDGARLHGGHGHYRKADSSDALIECCKAFESTMKIICAKRGWPVDRNATASALVKACLDRGFHSVCPM